MTLRWLALVMMIACGGGTKPAPVAAPPPPPPPAVAQPAPVESRPPDPVPVATPAPAPAPAPVVPLRDRLHDEDGPVPGMPGWNQKRVADATVCGGTRVVVSRGRRKLDPDQAALAKLYEVQFPADLNFDPAAKAKKEASLKRFDAYIAEMQKVGAAASDRYAKVIGDTTADPALRFGAAARIAQLSLRFAAALARAPIPADVRTGEFAKDKVDAYCSKMEEVAEPLVMRAQEALARACEKSADRWWAPLCSATN